MPQISNFALVVATLSGSVSVRLVSSSSPLGQRDGLRSRELRCGLERRQAEFLSYNADGMPTYEHIQRYREELDRLIVFGDSDNEQSILPAFQSGGDAWIGAVVMANDTGYNRA